MSRHGKTCIVDRGLSEENHASVQDRKVDFLVLSKGGLLATSGIYSENKWIYLGLDLIYNKLHRSSRSCFKNKALYFLFLLNFFLIEL